MREYNVNLADGWNKIETAFDGQLACYQFMRTGLVLEIADYVGEIEVNTLPENFEDDNQVIDSLGVYDSVGEAVAVAERYMRTITASRGERPPVDGDWKGDEYVDYVNGYHGPGRDL